MSGVAVIDGLGALEERRVVLPQPGLLVRKVAQRRARVALESVEGDRANAGAGTLAVGDEA